MRHAEVRDCEVRDRRVPCRVVGGEASGEVREGFYDLPEVPGVPGLATAMP